MGTLHRSIPVCTCAGQQHPCRRSTDPVSVAPPGLLFRSKVSSVTGHHMSCRSPHYPERCSKPGEASTSGREQYDQLVRFADVGCGFGGLLVK